MKKLAFVFVLIATFLQARSQRDIPKAHSMYYDALALSNYLNLDPKVFRAILENYAGSTANISSMISKDSFLRPRFDSMKVDSILKADSILTDKSQGRQRKSATGAVETAGILSASFAPLGGLDMTNVVDGIARFLVKRTKEELSLAFFDKFQKVISDTSHFKDLQTIFPDTYQAFLVIGDQFIITKGISRRYGNASRKIYRI